MREWLGFGKGEGNVEAKLVTVVYGNDLVNINFLNFQAMQEDIAKVTTATKHHTSALCYLLFLRHICLPDFQPLCQLQIIIKNT